jgi:hypothetical protein
LSLTFGPYGSSIPPLICSQEVMLSQRLPLSPFLPFSLLIILYRYMLLLIDYALFHTLNIKYGGNYQAERLILRVGNYSFRQKKTTRRKDPSYVFDIFFYYQIWLHVSTFENRWPSLAPVDSCFLLLDSFGSFQLLLAPSGSF